MRQRAYEGGGCPRIRSFVGLVLAALVALSSWTPGPVYGAVGDGDTTTTTYSTSTTHHTTYSTAENCTPQTQETVTTTQALGPGWICIGDDGGDKIYPNCSPGFPFEVVAGTVNYNTNTHTETFVCGAESIPTLSEWAQIGMAALLVGGGLWAMRRRADG